MSKPLTVFVWGVHEVQRVGRFTTFWADARAKRPDLFPAVMESDGEWQEHYDTWCSSGEPKTFEEGADSGQAMYYTEDEDG